MTIQQLAAIALFLTLASNAAPAAPAAACASLCGEWRLDSAVSDKPGPQLDAAFQQFKEPRERRPSRVYSDNVEVLGKADDEAALGPILDRPRRRELREELQRAARQPESLKVAGDGEEIRIAGSDSSGLSITPGEQHTRVDVYGTARIAARWRGSKLAISEKYDRRNQQETTYAVVADGSLHVVQVISRPGLPRVTVHSVYRRP